VFEKNQSVTLDYPSMQRLLILGCGDVGLDSFVGLDSAIVMIACKSSQQRDDPNKQLQFAALAQCLC